MNNLFLQRLVKSAVIGTVAIAASQAIALCYTQTARPGTQTGDNCDLYTNCPGGTICSIGGNGLPGQIVVKTLKCVDFVGGTGNVPGCVGGTMLLTTTSTVDVPTQSCPSGCSVPGGGSGVE